MPPVDVEFTLSAAEAGLPLDELEREFVGEANNLVFQAIQTSHDRLRESDYDVDSVIASLEGPTVDRGPGSITVSWRWSHPAASFFEYGTSEHTINGDPVLSFVWEDPPDAVREQFDREADGWRVFFNAVEVGGIDQTRFARAGLRELSLAVRS